MNGPWQRLLFCFFLRLVSRLFGVSAILPELESSESNEVNTSLSVLETSENFYQYMSYSLDFWQAYKHCKHRFGKLPLNTPDEIEQINKLLLAVKQKKPIWLNDGQHEHLFENQKRAMQLPVLTFPNANHTKHAKVQLTFPALHAVTVCSRVQWDTKASHVSTIFSYASPSFINEFQLRGQKDHKGDISLALIVHGHHTAYRALFENDSKWHHVCVTWQKSNGKWAIFVDGKEGHSGVSVHSLQNIEGNGVFIIGQDQDVLGGNFSDAFSGNISDLNIWSEVLDKKQIEGVKSCALIMQNQLFCWDVSKMAIEKNVKQSTMSLTCPDPRQSPIEECRTLSSSSSYPQQSFKVCKEERPFVCKIQKDSYLKLKEFEDNDKPFITNLIEESNSAVIALGLSSTSPKNLTTLEAQQVLQYTKQALERVNGSLAPSDLLTLVQFLTYVSDMDFDENETMETVDGLGQSFIEVAGEIFEEKHVHRWTEISQVVSGPMTVVQSIDRMAANLNTLLMTKRGEVVLQGKNIKLQFTQRILNENTSSSDFHGPNSTQDSAVDYISVPSEQLEELKRKGNQKVTFINTWYGSLHPFFVNGSGTHNDSSVSDGSQRLIGTILGSSVISTTAYSDIQKTNLAVHYRLQHKIETIPGIELKPSCTFWNYSLRPYEGGSWSTEGCFVTSTGPNSTSCFCNHTTNFAVLLQIYELQTTPAEDSMLRLLTFIGCGVSLFSLILTFILFIAVGVPSSDRTTVHKNLIVALATAEILLMFSDLASKNKEACIAVTALLHLFFMASFTWMLVEGLLLWSKVVSVNISEDRRMKFYYVIGWGLPVIIVGITLATSFNKYVADNYCWLNVQTDIIWSFVGPVLFVLFVNTVVLFRVVVVTVASARRRSKMMTPSCSTKSQKLELTWAATKPVLILLPVLGLTWLCGIFVNFTVVLAYIFIAMNAFQGLYIFLVYAVYNSEVRNAIQRMKEKKKALSFTNCSQPASFLSSPRNTDTSDHQKKSLPSLENSVSSIVQNGSMDKSLFYKNNGFRKESFVNFSVKPASKNQVDKTG